MAINRCSSIHTLAALSRTYLEEPGHMPFLEQQSMQRHPLHTSRIFKRFASEWKFGRGGATWTKTTLAIFQLWFHNFSAFLFKTLDLHLSWKAKKRYSSIIWTLFTSPFLCIKMITPVCQFFDVFPSFQATWHTLVSQHTLFPFNAFNIFGRILSSPANFLDFNPRMAAATSVKVKISSFPKPIESHVSVGVVLTGFNKSSKYFVQRERIPFSSQECSQLNPSWRLWNLNFSHAIGEWSAKILCLPMNSWNPTDDQIPPKSVLWTFLLPELQRFALMNTGIANQKMTWFATRPWTRLSLLG